MVLFIPLDIGDFDDEFPALLFSWSTLYHSKRGNMSSSFSINSEADASELKEKLEKTFL